MIKYHQGLRYAYMSNICFNTSNNKILYYYPSDNPNYRRITEIIERKTEYYRFGVKFEEISTPFPSNLHPVIHNKYVSISITKSPRHIGHVAENLHAVMNIVTDPNFVQGPIEYILFPNLVDEVDFNRGVMEAVQQYGSYYNYSVIYGKNFSNIFNVNIEKDPLLCFDQVVILDRNENISLGGIFTEIITSDYMRASVYHKFQFAYERHKKEKYNALVINRLGRRKFDNIDEIEYILKNNFKSSLSYTISYFDEQSFEYQVKAVYDNDIILISHGQGEITLLFAKPYSVCIEGNTPYFYEKFGHILSTLFRLYMIHPNSQYSINTSNDKYQKCLRDTLLSTYGGECKQSTILGNVYQTREYMKSSFQEAIDYLNGIDFDHYLPDENYIF
ncbi:hypothetical protein WA158_005441 [Blastocystis sp. Blastoise]